MFWVKYRECSKSFRFTSVSGTPAFGLKEIFKIIHYSSLFVWVLSESGRHSRAPLFRHESFCRAKYDVLPVCALEKVWELTENFLQRSHQFFHVKHPTVSTAIVWGELFLHLEGGRISLRFLGLRDNEMIEFGGKGSLSFGDKSRRWKTRIIPIQVAKKKTFSFKMPKFSGNVRK